VASPPCEGRDTQDAHFVDAGGIAAYLRKLAYGGILNDDAALQHGCLCDISPKTNKRITHVATDKSQNVQEVFLNHLRKNKTAVTVFLVNGVKLQGIITWFDNFSVLLRRDGHTQLVYKHAISTVMPGAPIQLFDGTTVPAPATVGAASGATPANPSGNTLTIARRETESE
jgi:host factor-I protein